jgi:hypothetical protein
LNIAPSKNFSHKSTKMRFAVVSLVIFMTIVSNYSAEASFENALKRSNISSTNSSDQVTRFEGASGHISRSEKRSFTSRSRAATRANLQRRNGSLLPDIVLPSITSAQSAPAPARPIPQAVSYPASAPVVAAAAPVTPVAPVAAAPVAAAPVAAAPVDQNYYTPQPAAQSDTSQGPTAQNNAPQKSAVQNYTPQQPAISSQNTPLPSFTLPTLVQAPKKKEDDDDEEEEDEDEEDEEDFDADDLVTRRR